LHKTIAMPRLLLALCLVAATFSALAGPLASQSVLPPFRVLVLPEDDAPLSTRAADRLENALQQAGFVWIDRQQAELLARRGRETLTTWLGGDANAADPGRQLVLLSQADILVRVGVETARQRKVQGRYLVRLRGSFRIAFADAAEGLGQGEGTAEARNLDGYDTASDDAMASLCDATVEDGLAARVVAALQQARDRERAEGARVTAAIYASHELSEFVDPLVAALETSSAVASGSVVPLRTYAGPRGRGEGDGPTGVCSEFGLRVRGTIRDISGAMRQALREVGATYESEHGVVLRPVVLASGRRLDVILRAEPEVAALADEVERVVREATETVYDRYGHVLSGKRLAIAPTSIAATSGQSADLAVFRTSFRDAYDRVEAKLAAEDRAGDDPMLENGSVRIGEQVFESLAAANDRLQQLEETFHESDEGALAVSISDRVGQVLREVSSESVQVQPLARDRGLAIGLIRVEAAAANEQESVDPETLAFFQQKGSEFLVSTRLRPFFDEYVVAVEVLDLESGLKMQSTASFPQRFTKELDAIVGG
jgi:hypothetical protein